MTCIMVSWRSWLARLLNNSDLIRSLGLTEEVAGSNPAEIILFFCFCRHFALFALRSDVLLSFASRVR